MAQHKSAVKRARRNAARTDINRDRVGRVRTFIKKVESAIVAGDRAAAKSAFQAAAPIIAGGVSRGVLHRNTAARKLSRLSARIKAMA